MSTVIAVVGHRGHGKSTLAAAMGDRTGTSPAAASDGSSHLSYRTQNRGYTVVDCTGDLEQMKGQLAVVGALSGAVLVVSATDGVMQGTREGLKLTRQLGARGVVVFLSRAEEIEDEEMFDLIEMEIRDQLAQHGFPEESTFIRSGAPQTEQSDGMTHKKATLALIAALEVSVP